MSIVDYKDQQNEILIKDEEILLPKLNEQAQILKEECDEFERIQSQIEHTDSKNDLSHAKTLLFLPMGTNPNVEYAKHWLEYLQFCISFTSQSRKDIQISSGVKRKSR